MGKKLSAYNLHMKRELKGKMKGKTKAQRKAVFKAAARKWKSKGKSVSRSKPKSGGSRRSSSTTRRSNKRMGKSSFNMNKILGFVPKIALAAPAVAVAMGPGTAEAKIEKGIYLYTGYQMSTGRTNLARAFETYKPYIFAKVIQAAVPKISSFLRSVF